MIRQAIDTTPIKELRETFYDVFDSPLGALTVSTDGSCITGLHIAGDRHFTAVPDHWVKDSSHSLLQEAKAQLEAYFAGTRTAFDLPIAYLGTPFQVAVWDALRDIPYGATTTYAAIAASTGKPDAVRAVGSAVGRNPLCIILPCHRVLGSDGALGGYVAGLECKEKLLALERQR